MTTLNINQVSWMIITSILLFGYVITWYSGLKHIPVSLATIILLLGSPITTLLSFIQTGAVSWQEVLGIGLALGGIVSILGVKDIKRLNLIHART